MFKFESKYSFVTNGFFVWKFIGLILTLLVPVSTLVFIFLGRRYLSVGGDFISYFVGAKIIAAGKGKLLYDLSTQYAFQTAVIGPNIADWVLPFRGVPFVLLIYLPLTILPLEIAYLIFSLGNFLLLTVLFYLFIITFNNVSKNAKYLFLLVAVFFPVLQTLWMGQLSILVTLVFLLIYINIKKGKYTVVGILTALLIIKAQYLLAAPFLLFSIRERKQYLTGFLSTLGFSILISSVLSSALWFVNYPAFLFATENPDYGSRFYDMSSLYANIRYLFPGISSSVLMLVNTLLYFATLLLFTVRSRSSTKDVLLISTILFTIVFSIHFLSFDYVLLLLPFYIIFDLLFKINGGKLGPTSVLAFFIYVIPTLAYIGFKPYLSFPLLLLGIIFLFWNNKSAFRLQI